MSEPAAPIETFARFQAGFFASDVDHCFLLDFMAFVRWACWKRVCLIVFVSRRFGPSWLTRSTLRRGRQFFRFSQIAHILDFHVVSCLS